MSDKNVICTGSKVFWQGCNKLCRSTWEGAGQHSPPQVLGGLQFGIQAAGQLVVRPSYDAPAGVEKQQSGLQ